MLQILQSKNPDKPLDTTYLERLKTIPQDQFEDELEQLKQSTSTASSALQQSSASYALDFASLSDKVNEISERASALKVSAASSRESASRVPAQPSSAYTAITQLIDKELQLYTHLDQVQELIQIPELLKTCVSSGMYAPAHDIHAFVCRLATRHPKSSVIARIQQSADVTMRNMRDILVKSLRESSKLQVIIKVLTLLRKMEPFKSNPQAALENLFIESRIAFMQNQVRPLQTLGASNAAMYLKRYIEQFREHVGATLSALSAVFGTTQSASLYVRRSVKDLAATMNTYVPRISEDRSRVLLQLTYCSYSLGRIGVEFWPLLDCELDNKEWEEAYNTQQSLSKAASEA